MNFREDLKETTFAQVPMRGTFYVNTVDEPSKMADLEPWEKTRLRARKVAEVQADPNSLITVAVNEEGRHRFFAAEDMVFVAKGEDDAEEDSDDSGNGEDVPDDAGGW